MNIEFTMMIAVYIAAFVASSIVILNAVKGLAVRIYTYISKSSSNKTVEYEPEKPLKMPLGGSHVPYTCDEARTLIQTLDSLRERVKELTEANKALNNEIRVLKNTKLPQIGPIPPHYIPSPYPRPWFQQPTSTSSSRARTEQLQRRLYL